jgi:predicted  nucleic acid-binding Zn-ribbon protein
MLAIEAIKEKLEETRTKKLEDILKVSGSSAISKTEYNVTVVDDVNVASSLIFKNLSKDKYDIEEVKKAIDLEITELKPVLPTTSSAKVDLVDYQNALSTIDDLRIQVESLQNQIAGLNGTIGTLNGEIESITNEKLSLEQVNDALVNQLNTLSDTIDEFALQIQNAVQKSVDESILRASLQAQNSGFKAQIEALIKQIDSLNSIIEGLQSQLGAVQQQQAIEQGTQSQALAARGEVISDVVVLSFDRTLSTTTDYRIYAKIKENRGGRQPESKWINGESIKFVNNDKAAVKVSIDVSYPENGRLRWFELSNSNFEVAPNNNVKVSLLLRPQTANGYQSKPGFLGYGSSKNYIGELRATVTRNDGSSETKAFKTLMIKSHPDSYPKND